MPVYVLRLFTLFLFGLALPSIAQGQAQSETPAASMVTPDPFGRGTPRAAVTSLIDALAAHDYDRAARYFDLPVEEDAQLRTGVANLAQRLQTLLDNDGTLLPYGALSNDLGGRVDDGLAIDQEEVGSILIAGKATPIRLVRRTVGDGELWLISRQTIRQLIAARPQLTAMDTHQEEENSIVLAGAPVKDWALLLGLAAFSFGGLWMLAALLLVAARRLISDPATSSIYRFLHAALPPLSLLIAVGAFFEWVERMSVAIVARQTLLRYTGLVALVAVVWFGLRLIDAIAQAGHFDRYPAAPRGEDAAPRLFSGRGARHVRHRRDDRHRGAGHRWHRPGARRAEDGGKSCRQRHRHRRPPSAGR